MHGTSECFDAHSHEGWNFPMKRCWKDIQFKKQTSLSLECKSFKGQMFSLPFYFIQKLCSASCQRVQTISFQQRGVHSRELIRHAKFYNRQLISCKKAQKSFQMDPKLVCWWWIMYWRITTFDWVSRKGPEQGKNAQISKKVLSKPKKVLRYTVLSDDRTRLVCGLIG